MQLDPKKQQQLKNTAFTLTYLNHALLSYLSALGAHRIHQNTEISYLLTFENHILNVLDKTCIWIATSGNNDVGAIEDSLEGISKHLLTYTKETTLMQTILLYNIAEVTLQILEQAKLFKLTTTKN